MLPFSPTKCHSNCLAWSSQNNAIPPYKSYEALHQGRGAIQMCLYNYYYDLHLLSLEFKLFLYMFVLMHSSREAILVD